MSGRDGALSFKTATEMSVSQVLMGQGTLTKTVEYTGSELVVDVPRSGTPTESDPLSDFRVSPLRVEAGDEFFGDVELRHQSVEATTADDGVPVYRYTFTANRVSS